MKKLVIAAAALFIASSAQASTIDFTDPFNEITPSLIANNPLVAQEIVDGVTFTITALDASGVTRLAQSYFFGSPVSGIRMGSPGNGTFSFQIEANQNVLLENIISTGPSSPNLSAIIDILLDGTTLISSGNDLDGGTDPFIDGPLALNVGHALVFNITNNSPNTTSSIDGIGFTVSDVPLPAGLPLLLSGIGILAAGRAIRKRAAAS